MSLKKKNKLSSLFLCDSFKSKKKETSSKAFHKSFDVKNTLNSSIANESLTSESKENSKDLTQRKSLTKPIFSHFLMKNFGKKNITKLEDIAENKEVAIQQFVERMTNDKNNNKKITSSGNEVLKKKSNFKIQTPIDKKNSLNLSGCQKRKGKFK